MVALGAMVINNSGQTIEQTSGIIIDEVRKGVQQDSERAAEKAAAK